MHPSQKKLFPLLTFIIGAVAAGLFFVPNHTGAQTTGGLWGHYGTGLRTRFTHTDSHVETVNFPNLGGVFVSRTGRADNAQVTWVGYVRITTAGSYRFRVDVATASQGSSFSVGSEQLWSANGDQTATKSLSVGWHYMELSTSAAAGQTNTAAVLHWRPPGGSEQVIPAISLTPEQGPVQIVTVPDGAKPKEKFNYHVTGIKLNEFPLLLGGGNELVSFSAWVKTTDSDGYIFHIHESSSPNEEFALRVRNGRAEFGATRQNGAVAVYAASSVSVNDNRWHHIVGVRSSRDVFKIYVDGVERGEASSSQAVRDTHPLQRMVVGAKNGSTNHFDGIIDDVRIYSRSLTESEVGAWFTGNNPPAVGTVPQVGLIGHWAFNDGSGSVAADVSRYNNDGTLRQGLSGGWTTGALGGALDFNGSSHHVEILDTGQTDNIIEVNLNAIVPPGESLMTDEVLIFWSEEGSFDSSPALRVRNIASAQQATVAGTPIVSTDGIVEGAWAKLPPSLVSATGSLRLQFWDDDTPAILSEGLAILIPFTDASMPADGRVSLYLSAGYAHSGITPAVSIPVQGITTLEPFFVFFDGETGYYAPSVYRPSYVTYMTGTDPLATPDRYSVLLRQGGAVLYPSASGTPRPFENPNPATWYPLFGRMGKNFDMMSSRFVANAWNGERLLGNSLVSPISLPANTSWVAFQSASSNLAADGVDGQPESVGFFAGVGAFSTLDIAEEPSEFDFSLSNSGGISVDQGESGATTIFIGHESGTSAEVTLDPADVTGLPPGATVSSFVPENCTPPSGSSCQSTITLQTTPATPLGNYSVRVWGESGTIRRSTNVAFSIGSVPPPTVSITAVPARITKGGFSFIQWSSSNAVSCTVRGPAGVIEAGACSANPTACNGSHNSGALLIDSEYSITCVSPGGTRQQSVNVSVKDVEIKEI